jgi:hypothetical protein
MPEPEEPVVEMSLKVMAGTDLDARVEADLFWA